MTVLQDALDVLDLDETARTVEFRREFVSYWTQRVAGSPNSGLALLRAEATDRDIYYQSGRGAQVIFADTEEELEHWLTNNGVEYHRPFLKTRLAWPSNLDGPGSYPKSGRDLIDMVGQHHLEGKFPLGGKFPVVLGMMIGPAPVFVATVLTGPSHRVVSRGFRPAHPRPQRLVADLFRVHNIEAMSIERIDPAWVHGRDSNPLLDRIGDASVAIIGCGAIGGYLARGLAQAGVGSLLLVDHDRLKAANLGRHVLGAEWIGSLKAKALAKQLARDFPHANCAKSYPSRFQDLTPQQHGELAMCTVLVLAGVDLAAELAVDRWATTLENPPARVWAWTEEFAHAGQAVALFGQDLMQRGLDAEGRFLSRATMGWDPRITTRGEAGCGVSFQPYDATDMMYTVLMTQRLVLDIVLRKVEASVRRSWYGDKDAVIELGAELSSEFDQSFIEKTFPWAW